MEETIRISQTPLLSA